MTIKNFSYTLDANEQVIINRVGRFIRCTAGNVPFEVAPTTRAGDYRFDKFDLENGIGVEFKELFDQLVITNGATAQTVSGYTSTEVVHDARQTLDITGTVITQQADIDTSIFAGSVSVASTSTTIRAARAGRHRLVLFNNGAQTVYISNATATVTDGFPIPPQQSKLIESAGPSGINGIVSAGTCDVRYWEEVK